MLISNIVQRGGTISLAGVPPVGSNSFSFRIDQECLTSAGVFTRDKHLVRTLWSGKPYKAGTYTEQWDGKDDEGNLVPGGNYEVTVLSNNMQYKWEGVIGNTSASFTGEQVYNNHFPVNSLVIVKNTAYCAFGYNEKKPSQQKFSLTNPQQKTWVSQQPGQASVFVAADTDSVYWAGSDVSQQWFVFATKVRDNSDVIFPKGQTLQAKYGRSYNAVGIANGKEAEITGLAVCRRKRFLFIAREQLNQLSIIDKNTGALVKDVSIPQPFFLSVDSEENLWVCHSKTTIEKFSVQDETGISSLNIRINDNLSPQAMSAAISSNFIAIADGNSQQVKAYSIQSGAPLWSFGQKGGYTQSALATNNKFFFTDRNSANKNGLCIAPDNSLWVGDTGNYRLQHFDASRTFSGTLMFIPTFYSCAADPNNPTRVFADYLEFEVDYNKPLAPDNRSWKLVRNWGAMVPDELDNKYLRMKCIATLSNTRTYTQLYNSKKNVFQIVEMGQNNQLRLTGINIDGNSQLYPDGSLRSVNQPQLNKPTVFSIRRLSGFDASGNPQWKNTETLAVSPPNTNEDPLYKGNLTVLKTVEMTESGVIVSFDANKNNTGWHLGGIREGDNNWLWRTARSTTKNYNGPFPPDGYFDIGNGVRNAGSVMMVFSDTVFWGYHGEFWKGSQTNKWNQVHESGLFLNQFGVTGPEAGKNAAPGMAGNVLSASVVKARNGKVYLYHNDENAHGGIHRWLISGFESIREQKIPLSLSHMDQGLLGVYFSGTDLNNTSVVSVVRDNEINFSSMPLGSVRWSGFTTAPTSGQYTFSVQTNGQLRVWLESNLIIDQWTNNTQNSFSAVYKLIGSNPVAIRIELANGRNIRLSWESSSQPREIIPKRNLVPASGNYSPTTFNLLDGLDDNGTIILPDNLYGWHRDPEEDDYTDKYNQWWSVQTKAKTYTQKNQPDIQIKFRKQNATAEVWRDIRLAHPVSSWALNAVFNFTGNQPNNSEGDGLFFDITDEKQKIISRLYLLKEQGNAVLYGNKVAITADNLQQKLKKFYTDVPVMISSRQGKISFSVAKFNPVTDLPYDPDADWRNPRQVRVLFSGGAKSADRIINIQSLSFTISP